MNALTKKTDFCADKVRLMASQSATEMRDVAARICRDYLSGAWKTISADELQLKRISGGLSNFLYYVSLPDTTCITGESPPKTNFTKSSSKRIRKDSFQTMLEPKEVLLRIYGQTHGEHALETMLTESVVFTLLSERKLGPKLHGIFPGGRIEQYIPARALVTSELSDHRISMKIAEKMAAIHSLDIPVSKEPDWLWNTMNRWLKTVEQTLESLNNDKNGNNVNANLEIIRKLNLRKEVEWLRAIIDEEDHPIIFSHNDMQEGNILFREDFSPNNSLENICTSIDENFDDSTQLDSHFSSILISNGNGEINFHGRNGNSRKRSLDDENIDNDSDSTRDSVISGNSQSSEMMGDPIEPELMIIDFEYCAYNYRGFDLANHFLEWTFEYTNPEFPYFYHRKAQYPTEEQQEKFITTYLTKLYENESYVPKPHDVHQVMDEVKCLTLASHLFWGLWAIVNVYQEIEFGYWEYATCRLNEYITAKELYTNMIANSGNIDDCDLK